VLVLTCVKPGASNQSVVTEFNEQNTDRSPVDQKTVGKIINGFKETRNIHE
jgi:hypothetical protein